VIGGAPADSSSRYRIYRRFEGAVSAATIAVINFFHGSGSIFSFAGALRCLDN
jgi:hypothetical protein